MPLAVLNEVRPDGFDWQGPGHRLDLVTALVRSLPKGVRPRLGPAPLRAPQTPPRLPPARATPPPTPARPPSPARPGVPWRRSAGGQASARRPRGRGAAPAVTRSGGADATGPPARGRHPSLTPRGGLAASGRAGGWATPAGAPP